ncbi:hypothetical protein BDV12DRAFT_178067 [Aspergillus spectabilis]
MGKLPLRTIILGGDHGWSLSSFSFLSLVCWCDSEMLRGITLSTVTCVSSGCCYCYTLWDKGDGFYFGESTSRL